MRAEAKEALGAADGALATADDGGERQLKQAMEVMGARMATAIARAALDDLSGGL